MEGGVLHCKKPEGRLSAGHCEVVDRGQARLKIDAKRYSRDDINDYGTRVTTSLSSACQVSKAPFARLQEAHVGALFSRGGSRKRRFTSDLRSEAGH